MTTTANGRKKQVRQEGRDSTMALEKGRRRGDRGGEGGEKTGSETNQEKPRAWMLWRTNSSYVGPGPV